LPWAIQKRLSDMLIFRLLFVFFWTYGAPCSLPSAPEQSMTALDKAFNIIGLALILVALLLSTASAQTAAPRGIEWLWPDQSVAAAQSTASLVQGFPGRARLQAVRALPTAAPFDRLVTLHNLCLADVQQNVGSAHCDQAIPTAAQVSRMINGRPVADVIRTNIARSRMMATAQTAKIEPATFGDK
jgi:hypothetical protein